MARGARAGGATAGGATGSRLRLADHPRATRQIRSVRAWVALIAFTVVLYLALGAGRGLETALALALQAGIGGFLVAWGVMVTVWRQLAAAEIELARRRIVAALLEMESAQRDGGAA